MNAQKLIPIAAIIFAACENTPLAVVDGGILPDPNHDSGVVIGSDAGESDAGEAQMDAMVTPEPARTFIERRMFGDIRVDNLVFDPVFDLTTYNWYGFSSDFTRFLPLEKHYLAGSPAHLPSIRVRKDSGVRGALVLGSAASALGMLDVSVWVGRAVDDAATTATAAAAIINIGPDGAETAIDLVSDPSSRIERDGVVWVRQAGLVSDALGVLAFLIGDDEREPFWVTAPVVVPVHHAKLRPDEATRIVGRALTPAERSALVAFEAAKRTRDDPRKRPERGLGNPRPR